MAKDTNFNLRNMSIYQVFPRQYSLTHDFEGVRKDLDRIRGLGTDILYLLPIHPIGKEGKKGTLGCPYSISDYSKIDPSLGTEEDFVRLIQDAHMKGMRVIIDVVYNHTSRDSYFFKKHPDFYNYDENGNVKCKVEDWSDVYDINYDNKKMQKLLIKYLVKWVNLGVDGFRCDVCSLIPYSFWKKARKACQKVNNNFFMLGETVGQDFGDYLRSLGYPCMTDRECTRVFDIIYDYDLRIPKDKFLKGEISVSKYLQSVKKQQNHTPENGIIARYVDNHDMERPASYKDERLFLRNYAAMQYFLKGTNFIYNGDEVCSVHRPSLFDYDEIDWSGYNKYDMADLIKKMNQIKKDSIFRDAKMNFGKASPRIAYIYYENEEKIMVGLFNFTSRPQSVNIHYSGPVKSLIADVEYNVNQEALIYDDPVILEISKTK